MCAHQLDLRTAQREIASDWVAAYKKYFKTQAPLPDGNRAAEDEDLTYPVWRTANAAPLRVIAFHRGGGH